MNVNDARKLIDLFLDDELPAELASEFKQAMFDSPELRSEVASLRQSREALWLAYDGDWMTEDERCRVLCRILGEAAISQGETAYDPAPAQLQLPLRKEA